MCKQTKIKSDLAITHQWIKHCLIRFELNCDCSSSIIRLWVFIGKSNTQSNRQKNVSIPVWECIQCWQMAGHKTECHIPFILIHFDTFAFELSHSTFFLHGCCFFFSLQSAKINLFLAQKMTDSQVFRF